MQFRAFAAMLVLATARYAAAAAGQTTQPTATAPATQPAAKPITLTHELRPGQKLTLTRTVEAVSTWSELKPLALKKRRESVKRAASRSRFTDIAQEELMEVTETVRQSTTMDIDVTSPSRNSRQLAIKFTKARQSFERKPIKEKTACQLLSHRRAPVSVLEGESVRACVNADGRVIANGTNALAKRLMAEKVQVKSRPRNSDNALYYALGLGDPRYRKKCTRTALQELLSDEGARVFTEMRRYLPRRAVPVGAAGKAKPTKAAYESILIGHDYSETAIATLERIEASPTGRLAVIRIDGETVWEEGFLYSGETLRKTGYVKYNLDRGRFEESLMELTTTKARHRLEELNLPPSFMSRKLTMRIHVTLKDRQPSEAK